MIGQIFASFAALAAATSGGVSARNQIIDVGGVKLEVPVPHGYCIPTGEAATAAQSQAALDDRNSTLLVLVDCRPGKAMENYLVIKTPLRMLSSDVTREELLQGLGSQGFDDPEFRKHLEAGDFEKHASDRTSQLTGQNVNFEANIAPRGLDETCAYLGGNSTVTTAGKTYTMAVATCITAVGKRAIALTADSAATSASAFEGLYMPLRDWALTIKPATK